MADPADIDPEEDWLPAVDKIRAACENGRLPKGLRGLLEEELVADDISTFGQEIAGPADELREEANELEAKADKLDEVAQSYEALADAVGAALDNVEEWEGAEDRDEKRDARETLLNSLVTVVDAFDETQQHDLDELGVGPSGPKIAMIVWKDGSPNFIDDQGFDIPYPEEDGTWYS